MFYKIKSTKKKNKQSKYDIKGKSKKKLTLKNISKKKLKIKVKANCQKIYNINKLLF